jgi:hypothetical protein
MDRQAIFEIIWRYYLTYGNEPGFDFDNNEVAYYHRHQWKDGTATVRRCAIGILVNEEMAEVAQDAQVGDIRGMVRWYRDDRRGYAQWHRTLVAGSFFLAVGAHVPTSDLPDEWEDAPVNGEWDDVVFLDTLQLAHDETAGNIAGENEDFREEFEERMREIARNWGLTIPEACHV